MEGQIVKILSNLYFVKTTNGTIYECHSRGKFRNQNITPVVGDYCRFNEHDKYILEILTRKNILVRPLVANIDQALIITSCKQPDFSTNLLDKLLVVLEHNKIVPIICMTKYDLLNSNEKKDIDTYISYYKKLGYTVLLNTELSKIKKLFKAKTTVFTGQTGAGKSTLINKLDKNLNFETGEISHALGRGKHTTRHVELVEISGGKVLDTPGFSSIDFRDLTIQDIKDAFVEFAKYPCPYKDCRHLNEKECRIKEEVSNGNILESRYNNYLKFIKEKW